MAPPTRTPGYASLAVHLDLSRAAAGRSRLTVDLADRFGAGIIGLAAGQIAPPLYGDAGAGYLATAIADDEQRRADEALSAVRAVFRAAVGARGDVEWRQALDGPKRHVVDNARAADLLVLGRRSNDDAIDIDLGVDPGGIAIECGRPVLVVPPRVESLAARSIVIAWKDTREARRAVRDALPFILRAEQVVVAAVTSPSASWDEGVGDVAALLTRYGVDCRVDVRKADTGKIPDEIIAVADETGSDLVVAGAYGRSRFREWMFGGVTRSLLETSPVTLLLSH